MKVLFNDIEIKGIASYLPPKVLDLHSLAKEYGENDVNTIIKTTGVERVRICEDKQTSSDLCYEAALHLLQKAAIDKSKIDGLAFVSQTPDYILPSTSILLQDRLGLTKDTVCLDIHYGCSGYIYGILQAALWINANLCENVLVLAGDTTSRMINPKDKSLRMVFGDCGTATLVSKGNYQLGVTVNSDGSGYDKLIVPAGGFRQPRSEHTRNLVFDSDKNGRSADDLFMDGMAIFKFALANVHQDIDNLLSLIKWKKEDVDIFALHQANEFMVNYIRKKLHVEQNKVPTNVTNYGNTGPASIPLLLSDLYSSAKPDLEKVIFSGFGVGLSWGSIACNLSNAIFYEPVNK
jgi:3-oxoacyl-[acyl-carrier-protein] synthase-3